MMKKKRIKLRKKPQQERSRQMIHLIIETTARILERNGMEELTTNKVANTAGISIGSLYQYFPNKESLIVAVCFKMMERDQKLFSQLDNINDPSILQKNLESLIFEFLNLHTKEGRLRTEVYAHVFRLGLSKEVLELREKIIMRFSEIIKLFRPSLLESEINSKAFVMFHECFGVMQAMTNLENRYDKNLIEKQLVASLKSLIYN